MPKIIIRPPKEELERAYLLEKMPSRIIGEYYGCSLETVLNWLHQYDIPVRHPGMEPLLNPTIQQQIARSRSRPVCETLKKHAEDLKDDPERLSTEFLQKMIGVEC